MDWIGLRNKYEEIFRKYRYVVLVLVVGMILMLLPESTKINKEPEPEIAVPSVSLSDELEQILSHIDGVGKVKVMLTERHGGETLYQTDEDWDATSDSESSKVKTVIITNGDRADQGLVRQVNPPAYLGAIVVCQGADRSAVQLSIVEAVANVTGISTDRITVLKMK